MQVDYSYVCDLIVPAVANAALTTTIDIGKITCSQYLAMPPALSSKFSAWMSGWFSYRNRRTFVEFGLHQTNVTNLKAWCQSNPSESVMVGLQGDRLNRAGWRYAGF